MPRSSPADDLQAEPRLKFGCHDFLNSQPILYPLAQGLVETPFDMVLDSPAHLADRLRDGELDLAFIPAVEYARIPRLKIVPGFSIAAEGEVRTVLMFSRKKMEEIKTVAVDQRSRTSVSLLKVLMHGYYGRDVSFSIAQKGHDPLENADAALLIGDEAFKIPASGFHLYDLSQEWFRFTGKPFVFSILCVASGVDADVAIDALGKAKEIGKGMLDEICRKGSLELGIPHGVCLDYLSNRIRYDLTPQQIQGLKLFYELAGKYGVIHSVPDIVFYSPL